MIASPACSHDRSGDSQSANPLRDNSGVPVQWQDSSAQIGEFVVDVYEDNNGNLWFGTINQGVARFNGDKLTYWSSKDGLPGNAVVKTVEDAGGNIWFATQSGLSMHNGKTFTNYSVADGLCDDRVSNLLFDKNGKLWIATWNGVCIFDGTDFARFNVPTPDVQLMSYQTTMNWVTVILEDSQGNIWFGRDGYGACKYEPATGQFTHFTRQDGLPSNNVQAIVEDNDGNIWFGCRIAEKDNPDSSGRTGNGGLARFNGTDILEYPDLAGLHENEIYTIYRDNSGYIWIGANGVGLYRYDGNNFSLFNKTDRPDLMPYGYGIQSLLEDKNGNLWLGLSGGLFRLIGEEIQNVTQTGPWH